MSKKINEYQTDLEAGVRTIDVGRGRTIRIALDGGAFEKFSLVVVKPMKGKKGELVFSADIHAESVSHAVRLLREQIDGSGLIVLQRADFELPIINPVIAEKLAVAYQIKYGV